MKYLILPLCALILVGAGCNAAKLDDDFIKNAMKNCEARGGVLIFDAYEVKDCQSLEVNPSPSNPK